MFPQRNNKPQVKWKPFFWADVADALEWEKQISLLVFASPKRIHARTQKKQVANRQSLLNGEAHEVTLVTR